MNPRPFDAYARRFAALGDPTRLQVFALIARSPLSVAEVAAQLPVSRPAVSQHLKALREAGLVRHEVDGTRRLYEVDPNGLGELRSWLDRFWSDSLAAFKAEAERPRRKASSSPSSPRRKAPR